MRIQTKIILLISAAVLSIGILSSIFVGKLLIREMENDAEGKGTILSQTLSELITNHVINHEVLSVREAITNVMQNTTDLEYIYVVGFDGYIIAHTFQGGFPRDLAADLHENHAAGLTVFKKFMTENGPVLDAEHRLISGMRGHIHIGLNQTHTYDKISAILRRIIGTAVVIVAFGILLGIVISRRIALPLGRLADSMRAFGEGKSGEEIAVTSGGNEVAQLASSFNRMITERRQAEDEIISAHARLEYLLTNSPAAIYTCEVGGDWAARFVSKNIRDILGYEYREYLEKPGFWIEHIHPEDKELILAGLTLLLENGYHVHEYRFLHKNGAYRWVHDEVKIVRNAEGKPLECIGYLVDITDRKKMEEELVRTEKLESIGILAGGIAHDFNNLLTAILGNISMAKMYSQAGEKTYERLADAEKASLRACDLTQQLLTFSKGGAPVKKTISLKELIGDSACFSLRGSGSTCEFSIADNLLPIDADEGQISQVMNNLVINARQAMPGGGKIRVHCENISVDSDNQTPLKKGPYIRISVTDEGVGIPKEHLEKIFEPFFTTKPKGSGLGLATSYSIVRNHGGHIAVESTIGVGTTFHVYLPASDREARKKRPESEMPSSGSGKILFMDDEEIVRTVAGEMLTNLGYDIEFAQDGAEAIELYAKAMASGRSFDCVIMDLTVPGGMGGRDAVKKLRELDPAAKVIVSSGYSNDPIMADFTTYGFSGVVSKPYTINNLSETVHALVSKGRD